MTKSGLPVLECFSFGTSFVSFFFFFVRSGLSFVPQFDSNSVASAKILPVVQKQHQLLVTLLLCNAAAMEVPGSVLILLRRCILSSCK